MAEYGEQGLTAYNAHPGGVPTEIGLGMPSAYHSHLVDTPELGADSFVWLTSERREWLNDRYLTVNWDMQELLKKKEEIVEKDLLRMLLRT